MKKNIRNTLLMLAALVSLSTLLITCTEDTTTTVNPPGGGGGIPKVRLKSGSSFTYTNDSISQNGTSTRTNVRTRDSILNITSYQGFNAYPVKTVNDTGGVVFFVDTFYVRYDSIAGKFYQWGIAEYIDPNQGGSWDLIGDFSVPRGQEWTVNTITVVYGTFTINAVIKSKVAADTTILTTSIPADTIKCFRLGIKVDMTNQLCGNMGTIYVDYYLGYSPDSDPSNPSGLVRLRLRPFTLVCIGNPVYSQSGFDRILRTYTIP